MVIKKSIDKDPSSDTDTFFLQCRKSICIAAQSAGCANRSGSMYPKTPLELCKQPCSPAGATKIYIGRGAG